MSSTSSTRPFEPRRLALIGGLIAGLAATWLGVTVALERLTIWAEVSQGHYLWGEEEWLDVLTPARYRSSGNGALLLTGASEAREAFLVEAFAQAFPTDVAIDNSQSLGTLHGVTLQLEYIQKVYGRESFPHRVVLGLSPRMVFNDPGVEETPLFDAINRYSPHFSTEVTNDGFRLLKRERIESVAARLRFAGKQRVRYKNALRASILPLVSRLNPAWGELPQFAGRLDPYKYLHLEPIRTRDYWAEFREDSIPYDTTPEFAGPIHTDARRLLNLIEEAGSELIIVVLPQAPWIRATYRRGFQKDFIELLREAYPGVPLIDLSYELGVEHYYDHNHVNISGAKITTDKTIDWMQELKEARL